jgi:hypothetical protein
MVIFVHLGTPALVRVLLLAPQSGVFSPYETLNIYGRPGLQNWSGLASEDNAEPPTTVTRKLIPIV